MPNNTALEGQWISLEVWPVKFIFSASAESWLTSVWMSWRFELRLPECGQVTHIMSLCQTRHRLHRALPTAIRCSTSLHGSWYILITVCKKSLLLLLDFFHFNFCTALTVESVWQHVSQCSLVGDFFQTDEHVIFVHIEFLQSRASLET